MLFCHIFILGKSFAPSIVLLKIRKRKENKRYVADKRETAACYAEFFKGKEDITFFTEPAAFYWLRCLFSPDL